MGSYERAEIKFQNAMQATSTAAIKSLNDKLEALQRNYEAASSVAKEKAQLNLKLQTEIQSLQQQIKHLQC